MMDDSAVIRRNSDYLHRMKSRLPAEQPLSLTLIREQEAMMVKVRLRMEA